MEKIFKEEFSVYLILIFTAFAVFRYFQYCFMRDYEGIKHAKKITADIFNTAGFLFEYAFLVYYGYLTIWYFAVSILVVSFCIKWLVYGICVKDKKGRLIPLIASIGFLGTPIFCGLLIYEIIQIRSIMQVPT